MRCIIDLFIYICAILFLISVILSFEITLIENAYLSLSSQKLKKLEEENPKKIELIRKLFDDDTLYTTTLVIDYIANGICAISLGLLLTSYLGYLGLLISIVVSAVIIIVFGELVPKSLGAQKFEKIVLSHSILLSYLHLFFKPLCFIIKLTSNVFLKITGGNKNFKEPLITEDDFIDAVSLGIEEGIIDKNESKIIENVFDFKDCFAKDIMTPRTDIVAVNILNSYDEIVKIVQEEQFSRMPVYDEDLDNIIGILNVKDIVGMDRNTTLKDNLGIIRRPFYTYEFKPIGPLFNEMRHKKISVAIVNDEYGGTEGMITIEDLIEKIVGSISDEYDEDDDEDIVKIGVKDYLIDGSMSLIDFNDYFNTDFESEESDSIAGYIIEKLDRFPVNGEEIELDGLNFTVKSTKKNRIEKLILKK